MHKILIIFLRSRTEIVMKLHKYIPKLKFLCLIYIVVSSVLGYYPHTISEERKLY